MPYPDDLDDSFGALSALIMHDPSVANGEMLAAVASMLTAAEEQEGGPYRTWLVGPQSAPVWQDIDPAVNGTVYHFLSLVGIRLARLEEYLGGTIKRGLMTSPYYPGSVPVMYFIARSYRGSETPTLAEALAAALRRAETNVLERAMIITSLANLGLKARIPRNAVQAFIKDIVSEGWRPHAFCIDPARGGKTHYAGSSALTAAFCIEALEKVIAPQAAGESSRARQSSVHDKIRRIARTTCNKLPEHIRNAALRVIDKTNDEKITTLAYDFRSVLAKRGKTIPLDLANHLALSNLYGWMAYDIYDDFLDEEGDPALLSAANFFLRELAALYRELDRSIPGSWTLFETTLNAIDNANAWEQANCRVPSHERAVLPRRIPDFGDFGMLAERSIGHALGPLVALMHLGHRAPSREYQAVQKFMKHYIIARQLDDDAHDWPDDLVRGQINAVGAMVLKECGASDGSLRKTMPQLQLQFWKTTIDRVAAIIFENITMARAARASSRLLRGSSFLESALASLERSANRAISQRDEMLTFLKHYQPENGAK